MALRTFVKLQNIMCKSEILLHRIIYHKDRRKFCRGIKIAQHLSCNTHQLHRTSEECENKPKYCEATPEFDWDYLLKPSNVEIINTNICNRKGVGDIYKVHSLWKKVKELLSLDDADTEESFLDDETAHFQLEDFLQSQEDDVKFLREELIKAAAEIPNDTHPDTPIGDESCAKLIAIVGKKKSFTFKPAGVEELGISLDCLRTHNLGHTTGHRSYYFKGMFAQLQSALVRYTVDVLRSKGFEMVYIPDMIHPSVVEGCGFKARGERTQVYHLDPAGHGPVCLAGTGEMPIAGMFQNATLSVQQLPKKCMTVSRCYRAETSDVEQEKGIYRVHQFTKVEMFGVTSNETGCESEDLVEEFLNIQKYIFSQLGLHFRILEMPTQELGAPAYRKFDMEAWMPYKEFWGEISSTSNCLDYQSRRLNIRYWGDNEDLPGFIHTVNGTACAVPRIIMAITENYQNENGEIEIPTVLQPYMRDQSIITKSQTPLKMQWIKLTKTIKKQTEK